MQLPSDIGCVINAREREIHHRSMIHGQFFFFFFSCWFNLTFPKLWPYDDGRVGALSCVSAYVRVPAGVRVSVKFKKKKTEANLGQTC